MKLMEDETYHGDTMIYFKNILEDEYPNLHNNGKISVSSLKKK